MRKEKYPLEQFKHMASRIEQESFLQKHRHWTGNDDIDRHYHIAVPRHDDHIYVHLFWKRGRHEPVEFVGTFNFHVQALLSEGYIREDGDGMVRFRICHCSDDLLYIQTKSGKPAIAIGELVGS